MDNEKSHPPDITWSTECAEIFAAFAKAQSSMRKLTKNRKADIKTKSGKDYNYGYADLPATLEACLDAFNEQGIGIFQAPRPGQYGVDVTTLMTHESGQWILTAPLFVPVDGNGAQDQGGGITFARRYALQAAVGLSPAEDDDGASAQANAPASVDRSRQHHRRNAPPRPAPKCTGKAQGIADAIRDRRLELAKLVGADPVEVYSRALAEFSIPNLPPHRPEPEQLDVPHGVQVKDKLTEWLEYQKGQAQS